MKLVFFGTPEYVLPVLTSLHKTFKSKSGKSPIVAVVTQKPKPTGRKQKLTHSPIDNWARKRNVPVFYEPKKIIEEKIETDAGILAAYGEILPKKVIDYFPRGILNIHPSLLPKFRGASPVQAILITGGKAGATIIKLNDKMDNGPIISQFEEKISDEDTTQTLSNRLFQKCAGVLSLLLPDYIQGKIKSHEQDHKKASFTTLIKKSDAFIPPEYLEAALQTSKGDVFKGHWKIPFIKNYTLNPNPYSLDNFIRAMQPWPISWTYVQLNPKSKSQKPKRLKILKAHVEDDKLILDTVQLEGKKSVSWKQFKNGYPEARFS